MSDSADQPKAYKNMAAAVPDIIAAVVRRLGEKPGETVTMRTIGYKLGVMIDIAEELAKNDAVDMSRLTLKMYLPTADYVRGWAEPPGVTDANFDLEADRIENAIVKIKAVMPQAEVVPYWSLPFVYGWIVDDTDLFVGYATWNLDDHVFNVAFNPCYHVTQTEGYFGELRRWVLNRCDVFDLWTDLPNQSK